jgi:hypothetical protein
MYTGKKLLKYLRKSAVIGYKSSEIMQGRLACLPIDVIKKLADT